MRTICMIFGDALRIRVKKFKQICLKITQKILKQPLQHANFQKFPGNMFPDPPRAFLVSQSASNWLCRKRIRLERCEKHAPLFYNFSQRHCAHEMTFYFALHLNLSGKLDICGRAALGFKIFSNAALRVNIIAHPCS